MKILAIHLNSFIEYARLRGMSRKELTDAMKIPPDWEDPLAKVEETDFYAVVALIAESLQDELLGLRVGNHLNLNTLGAIYKISLKATTSQEALFYCQDYLRKTFPPVRIINSVSGRSAAIELNMKNNNDQVCRLILETMLTVIAREINIISGEDTYMKITTPFHHAGYPPEWEKGKSYTVKFRQSILKAALQDNSTWGLDILIPEYLSLIQRMEPAKSFSSKVRIMALHMAKPKLPDLDMVSKAFDLNARTFQRRLILEGVTFRQIMEGLKQDICHLLIRHERFSIADISSVLGYSEPASFIHAFKKWHGRSPEKARKEDPGLTVMNSGNHVNRGKNIKEIFKKKSGQ